MPKGQVKYWVTGFDNKEKRKDNPKAPAFKLILKDPDTNEEFEGALFPEKSKSGNWYLSGSIQNDKFQPNGGGGRQVAAGNGGDDEDCPF